jgi:hypothetical protein
LGAAEGVYDGWLKWFFPVEEEEGFYLLDVHGVV